MSAPEFQAWPKTPRLFRDAVITEKIDGTNAAVIIEEGHPGDSSDGWSAGVETDDGFFKVGAQSRTRIITPGKSTDNFGFARWVQDNAPALVAALGPGRHFGEWWGKGIQRGYGLDHRRFSLFNTERYGKVDFAGLGLENVGVVPVLARRTLDTTVVGKEMFDLSVFGSRAAYAVTGENFVPAEGVVVYHSASRQVFKALLESDHLPKGVAERELAGVGA